METSTLIQDTEIGLAKSGVTRGENKDFFIAPVVWIIASATVLLLVLATAFYFYPLTVTAVLVISLLSAKIFLTRKRLTFFDEQYAPDEDFENI